MTNSEAPPQVLSPIARPAYDREPVKRPNGGGLMMTGGTMIALGAAGFLIAIFTPDIASPGSPGMGEYLAATPPTYNFWKWPLLWISAGAMNLGLLLWSLGLVVRSLFFLPGRAVTQRDVWGGGANVADARHE